MTDASTQIIALENGDIDAIRSPSISSCLNLNEPPAPLGPARTPPVV